MTAKLIDGKAIAASVRAAVKERVEELVARTGVPPGLTVVLVGEDPASQVYVRNKGKAASEAGFLSRQIDLPAETKEAELLDLVGGSTPTPPSTGSSSSSLFRTRSTNRT